MTAQGEGGRYVYRQMSAGKRPLWFVVGDTSLLKLGDVIVVTKRDGTTTQRIVKRVQRRDAVDGMCVVFPEGTPPIKIVPVPE